MGNTRQNALIRHPQRHEVITAHTECQYNASRGLGIVQKNNSDPKSSGYRAAEPRHSAEFVVKAQPDHAC